MQILNNRTVKTFLIKGKKSESKIILGEKLKNINKYLPNKRVIVITDVVVNKLYGDKFNNFDVIEIGLGEKNKTLQTIENIIEQLLDVKADRNVFLLGVGGGIVCDITGFIASIFMRGVNFGFVSTSLLSQVDASIGGKNGVNFLGYKNIIGIFNQPKFVICDVDLLKTLPQNEINCGFGEIVKHSIISGVDFFNFINDNITKIKQNNLAVLNKLIELSIIIKSKIVNSDEQENGTRKILNFGHTIAHAIEKQTNLSHGEAVAIGIKFAVDFSFTNGFLSSDETKKIKKLISNLNLVNFVNIDKTKLSESLNKDKKKNRNYIDFVFVKSLGNVFYKTIEIKQIQDFINTYNF
ncbi:MAG: 3-dehydroquinate synthase [Bacteroidetes bacterium]|nr:MAG: 3-dehydroquinate synthase [Bacteroidota bacterium]